MSGWRYFPYLLLAAWGVLLGSMLCSLRAVSSIAVGLIIVLTVLPWKNWRNVWRHDNGQLFFLACVLFYFIQAILSICTGDIRNAPGFLQTKSAILFVPLAVIGSSYMNGQWLRLLLRLYTFMTVVVMLFCLCAAGWLYVHGQATADIFFYHALVSPFHHHAVQVSFFVFAALVFLLAEAANGSFMGGLRTHYAFIVFLLGCLVLLSSKLILSCAVIVIGYYALRWFRLHNNGGTKAARTMMALLVCAGLAILILKPVEKRFQDILQGDPALVTQSQFSASIYFNGLQFRLLQWRFVTEVLDEQHAWLTGVSSHAQELLNGKYRATKMYTAGPTGGYLGYNTHNAFLEALLQSGIIGLLSFLLVIATLARYAWRAKAPALTAIVATLIAYCFTESVIETQYGAMLFTLFPLLFFRLSSENRAVFMK